MTEKALNARMQETLYLSSQKTIDSLSGLSGNIDYVPHIREHFLEALAQVWDKFPLSVTKVSNALRDLKQYSDKPFLFNVKKGELIAHLHWMKDGKVKNNSNN